MFGYMVAVSSSNTRMRWPKLLSELLGRIQCSRRHIDEVSCIQVLGYLARVHTKNQSKHVVLEKNSPRTSTLLKMSAMTACPFSHSYVFLRLERTKSWEPADIYGAMGVLTREA